MADGMFGAATGVGPAQPLSSGSPEYQQAIVGNVQKQLAPAYRQALQGTQQAMAGRGLMDSGTSIAARMGTQQDYLRQMGDVATQAATKGADVAEQNRRAAQQHQWDVQNQERLLNFQREMADRQQQQAGQQAWSNLIGGAAGAVGGALFGPALGMAGTGIANLFGGQGGSGSSGGSTFTPSSSGVGLSSPGAYDKLSYKSNFGF